MNETIALRGSILNLISGNMMIYTDVIVLFFLSNIDFPLSNLKFQNYKNIFKLYYKKYF